MYGWVGHVCVRGGCTDGAGRVRHEPLRRWVFFCRFYIILTQYVILLNIPFTIVQIVQKNVTASGSCTFYIIFKNEFVILYNPPFYRHRADL